MQIGFAQLVPAAYLMHLRPAIATYTHYMYPISTIYAKYSLDKISWQSLILVRNRYLMTVYLYLVNNFGN